MSEEVKTTPKETAPKDKAFGLSVLRKNSMRLFNVSTSTFDGAMAGQTGPLTINAAKGIIEKWKKGVAH